MLEDLHRRSRVIARIMRLVAATAAVAVGVGAISFFGLRWALDRKDRALVEYLVDQRTADQLQLASERRARKLRTFLLTGNPRFLREHAETVARVDRLHAELTGRLESERGRAFLVTIGELYRRMAPLEQDLIRKRQEGAGPEAIAAELEQELQPVRDDLDEALTGLVRHAQEALRLATSSADRAEAFSSAVIGVTVALSLVTLALLGLTLRRSVAELTERQRAAAQADAFRRQVMGIVGHDIRSPLTAILTWAELNARVREAPDQQRRDQRIVRSAKRIEQLAGLLLDFTRLGSPGGLIVHPLPSDLHEVVAEVIDIVGQDGTRVGLELAGDGHGLFDPGHVHQAARYLVRFVATNAGDRPVRVISRGANGVLEVEVVGTGLAIPPAVLPRLFEPFSTEVQGGTVQISSSIGLWVAHEIARAHQGDITVRTGEGGETVFLLRLPRRAVFVGGT